MTYLSAKIPQIVSIFAKSFSFLSPYMRKDTPTNQGA